MPPYRSHRTTQGRAQTAARALWRATGTAEADLAKPIVAIAKLLHAVRAGPRPPEAPG